jgi:hypothetical protein
MSAPPINTTSVVGRRQLTFNQLADVLADVEMLANAKQIRHLGNWPPGQVLEHLTHVMNGSIDGFPQRPPRVIRFFLRLLFKKRFLTRPMSPGFNLPRRMEANMVPAAVPFPEALERFRRAFQRLQTETPGAEHPALGAFTPEEWQVVHCRHSELHLSFLIPE